MMPEGLERLRNARILVVEDSIANQTLARDLLLHAGAHVDLAGNGREAINAIRNAASPYDGVLMDLQMPIMDGLEATRIIRGELAQDSLPIIATTANIGKKEQKECLAAGATDCLPKPFHIHELYAVLIRCLKPVEPPSRLVADDAGPVDEVVPRDVVLPATIEGVDIEGGLARIGQKCELYARLLVEFAATNAQLRTELDTAAGAGDLDRIRFLAHGIRSTAGNIGADALSAVAANLERAIVNGDNDIMDHFASFCTNLDEVVVAIRAARIVVGGNRAVKAATKKDLDGDAARESIEKLLEMLEDQDLEAQWEFGKLADMLGGHGHDEALSEMEENIEALQFASARQILSRLGEVFLK